MHVVITCLMRSLFTSWLSDTHAECVKHIKRTSNQKFNAAASFPGLPFFFVLWFVSSASSGCKPKNKNGGGLGTRLTVQCQCLLVASLHGNKLCA